MAWTTPYTPAPGDMMTAAIWAPQVRDNLNVLRAGELTAVTIQGDAGVISKTYSAASNVQAIYITQANAGGLGTGIASALLRIDNRGNNDAIAVSNNATLKFTVPAVASTGVIAYGNATPLVAVTSVARGSGLNYIQFNDPTGIKGYVGYTDGASDLLSVYNALSAPVTFGTNNAERIRIHASGGVSIGNTTDPGAAALSVSAKITSAHSTATDNVVDFRNTSGTGYGPYIAGGGSDVSHYSLHVANSSGTAQFQIDGSANVRIGGVNITDGVGTPSLNGGEGAGATINGKSYAFKVTCGSSASPSINILWGTTYANAPIVTITGDATVGSQSQIVPSSVTTTGCVVTNYFGAGAPSSFLNGQIFYVQVRGC